MRPAPLITDDNRVFWDAARQDRLVAQRCTRCGRLQHPPRPACPQCHALTLEAADLSGRGTIYTYAVLHHPRHPSFEYPVVAALVDLDEGVRVMSNIVDVEPSAVHIGMRVRVQFIETDGDAKLPVFAPEDDRR
jgi:uncharacterized OB-fold protein